MGERKEYGRWGVCICCCAGLSGRGCGGLCLVWENRAAQGPDYTSILGDLELRALGFCMQLACNAWCGQVEMRAAKYDRIGKCLKLLSMMFFAGLEAGMFW